MTELSQVAPSQANPALPVALAPLGAVSEALERELRRTVKERGLVVWLDADNNYSAFVDDLLLRAHSGAFPYAVVSFRGSFLELMLALEKHGNDLHPDKVLIHMPGFNEQTISETPLLELYKAGKRYRKALDTLITEAATGLVRPRDLKAFLDSGKPTLESADRWLESAQQGEQDQFLIGLEERTPESALSELLSRDSKLYAALAEERARGQFGEYLHRTLGLDLASWSAFVFKGHELEQGEFGLLCVSWLMAVEFVSDLQEPPVTRELLPLAELPKPLIAICHALVAAVRERFPDVYRDFAAEFEDVLDAERNGHQPSALGSIDTFRFEEAKVREAALAALALGDFAVALNYAEQRHPETCFWVRQDKNRDRTWQLVRLAADVGRALDDTQRGLVGCHSLEEATHRYRDGLFAVDRAHRLFEQRFYALHGTELEDEAALRDARDAVRKRYRSWADALGADFGKLCGEVGALPGLDLRQRTLYEQVVHPLIEAGERVAFFMVDAMRFEMADELRDLFKAKRFKVTLDARLAELPTITAVGMNALAPVSQKGRLRPVISGKNFAGFRTGERFTVRDPESRVRAMASRSVKDRAIDLELADVVSSSTEKLERVLRSKNSSSLIVVRSLEIDSAGEKGLHLSTFEQTLVQIREAVQRLQRAGISHFVLSADHGFLLQDPTTQKIEYRDAPQRRHVLTSQRSGMADVLELPLSALEYDVDQEEYLILRNDTATWKTREKIAPFVHGGNSLQERVIPVLVLERRIKAGSSASQYEIIAAALPPKAGRQRLSLKVRLQRLSSGVLSFAGPKKISLALRVQGHDVAPQIVEVTPPGVLETGALMVPPGAEEVFVTFFVEGLSEDKVKVEIYHPDGAEQVRPTLVQGWFEMQRNRRLGKAPAPVTAPGSERAAPAVAEEWQASFEDAGFRTVFEMIARQESVNEQELLGLLESPRRMRAFARQFDRLKLLVPFEVQIMTVGGMKSYVRGAKR